MSSTGTTTCSSSALRTPASTIVTGRAGAGPSPGGGAGLAGESPSAQVTPPRRRAAAAWQTGRCAAADSSASASRRSSERARCAPRFVPASAWISSTMTQRTLRSASRAADVRMQVQRLGRGDEDVRRPPAEGAPLLGRGVARPHRHAHLARAVAQPLGRQGDAGQRRPQVALHVVDERLERRDVQDPQPAHAGRRGGSSTSSRSRHQRNAASVLPLPVGAQMSVCSPAAMAGQPRAWASVGPSNEASNHSRVAAAKGASGSAVGRGLERGTGPASYHRGSRLAHPFGSRRRRHPLAGARPATASRSRDEAAV